MNKFRKKTEKDIEDIAALTPMQEGMLFHYLKDPQHDHYFEQLSLEVAAEIDVEIFKKAWNFVIETNEMLRTSFRWEKLNKPAQVVMKNHTINLTYHDLSTKEDVDGTKRQVERIKQEDRNKKFDLREVPFRIILCKIEADRYYMIISNHHILMDGWSTGVILKEFVQANDKLCRRNPLILPAKTKFKEFVKWIQEQETGEQEKFWQEYLNGFDTRTELPTKRKNRENGIKAAGSYKIGFSRAVSKKAEQFVKKHKLTMASLFYGVWGLLLQRYNDCEDVVFGTVVSGRTAKIKGIEDMVGLFINTLPLRMQCPIDEKAVDVLNRVDHMLLTREKYENTPLVHIIKYSEIGNNHELFDSLLALENYPIYGRLKKKSGSLVFQSYSMVEMTHYALTLQITLPDHIELTFNYNRALLEVSTIEKLARDFMTVAQAIIDYPGQRVRELHILSKEEKKQILYEFNDTIREYPGNKIIQVLFADQVDIVPHRIAVEYQDNQLSYRELNDKTDRLAARLIQKGVTRDTVVGVLVERSLEMIIGILAILKANGSYLPIDTGYPLERIRYILKDSMLKWVLTRGSLENQLENIPGVEVLDLLDLNLYRTEEMYPAAVNSPAHLAYVIYTSGSTGLPKGVMIDHQSVTNLLSGLHEEYPFRESDTYLLKTSYVFDVSVTELFGWILGRGRLAIVDQNEGKDPQEILKAIERLFITHINFVPSMFKAFIELLNHEKIEKLASLKYIFLAGEALLPDLAAKFRDLNTAITLENIYGPTESTVYSSKYSLADWNGIGSIPIGKPLPNIELYILSKYNNLQPIGTAGQLYIGGPGIARGYLNRPELTEEKFISTTKPQNRKDVYFSWYPGALAAKLYKTGDLARWLPDGNIDFIGRIDSQVKIRGFRIELEEIESQLLKRNEIKEAVVVARENESREKFLCAYIVSPKDFNLTSLRGYLSGKLPGFMIPSYFISIDKIPLTPNGKVDRKALPQPEMKRGKNYTAPRNEIEKKLLDIWSEILDVEKEKIGINDNFFHLGGHSLKATILVSKIHKELNINVPLTGIFKTPHIHGLAAYIKEAARTKPIPVEPVEKKEYYPLSSAQRRFYILQQMDAEGGTGYNIPSVWQLEGELDGKKIEVVFQQLIRRHESLRTFFTVVNDSPVQRIKEDHNKFRINSEILIGTGDKLQVEVESFIRPFNLSQAPLLRVRLIKLLHTSTALPGHPSQEGKEDRGRYLLMVDMHHIISDGLSIGIFIKEFTELYKSRSLAGLRLQYRDYSEWHNRKMAREFMKEKETYWLKQFEGEVPLLDLPADYPRPAVQGFAGRTLHFEMNKEETAALKSLAREQDVTLFMLLLSVYTVFLGKISHQEDIVVGTPIAGRRHTDLEGVIGMFVNTLALRNSPVMEKTFHQFLMEIKENTINAFENQDYLYEDLVEQVEVERDTGRNPLFDTMFALQNMDTPAVRIPGLKIVPYRYESRISKFDLTLTAVETGDRMSFTFEYCTHLFKKETIQRFIGFFEKIVSTVRESYETRISGINIITEEEKNRILLNFNDTGAEYPRDKTIHQLFAEQVEKFPDYIAVLEAPELQELHDEGTGGLAHLPGHMSITYSELNRKSNQLAYLLLEKGVGPDIIVGIMMERSIEMIIGILGILKARGAYLPIDPEYPQERITYMLKDSSAKILVTAPGLSEKFEKLSIVNCQLLMVNEKPTYRRRLNDPPKAANLAYIIYTSGSTGKPKGVIIQHGSLVNVLSYLFNCYPCSLGDTYLFKTPYVFDVSLTELFGWFLGGGRLAVLENRAGKDPQLIIDTIKDLQVTHINFVPSMFNVFIESFNQETSDHLSSLKYIFLAGEALSPHIVERFTRNASKTVLENIYGPTEATIYTSKYSLSCWSGEGIIPIGKPLQNTTLYILNRSSHLQPPGVTGELCISGEGLARGYLNRPELTNDKFDYDLWDYQDDQDKNKYHRSNRSYRSYISNKIYKTGDLARWLPDGNIEFLGRIDHQVKIRGHRIELGEIENHLLQHAEVKEAVVVVRGDQGVDNYLCAYTVLNRVTLHANEDISSRLRKYLYQSLPDYMIPSFFVPLEDLPLTPSGKIDRKALPEPLISAETQPKIPGSVLQRKLAWIWSEVLRIEMDLIDIDRSFFELGGHSLRATVMVSKIHKELNVKIPLTEVFKKPSIRALSGYIHGLKEETYTPIKPVEKKGYYKMSSAQKRLYVVQQMNEQNIGFNLPFILILEGHLERTRLETSLGCVIKRHESLRTSFEMVGSELVQRIHETVDFAVEYHEEKQAGERLKINSITRAFVRPFHLSRPPLLRVGLIEEKEDRHIFMMDMHHIISDGTSLSIFTNEFVTLYQGEQLSPMRLQYRDYTEWNNSLMHSEEMVKQKTYWLELFEDGIPGLNIKTDFQRPQVQDFQGHHIITVFEKELTTQLRVLIKETNTTLYIMLLTVFTILMSKYSGQDDIVVGSGIAGRKYEELENIIGMFANLLPMRNLPLEHKVFRNFLEEVKKNALNAFENQDYPFDELVSQLAANRDLKRNPLFDVVFQVNNFETESPGKKDSLENLTVIPYEFEFNQAHFDLSLSVRDTDKYISMSLEYSTSLFKPSTAERISKHFLEILDQVLQDIYIKLEDITLSDEFLVLESTNIFDNETGEFGF
ncbi:MAG: amino acid adenylation domain-containing protein [Candidatus Aminicenantes bacterium]|nr:MAG: amino acid adenylation domain-containing protein [Candidatus Aminicenantes bacterium]